jgi:ceramide glucosyltransferase
VNSFLHPFREVVGVAAALGAIGGIAFYLACVWSAHTYLKTRVAPLPSESSERTWNDFPPVSILKPLKGEDPEMYQSLRSYCQQQYPQYEIIFGVNDKHDPAIASVERLRQEFPQHSIHLLVSPKILGENAKVSNLAHMVAAARYDHFVVSDSDIRIEPDYLQRVIAPLRNEKTGMVTCLYRGIAGATLGSRLESVGISTDFCAGVLVARAIEGGLHFALGSTMAFRRRDLEAIGGFPSFVDYLADDYELGRRISGLGLAVHLSEVVVETFLPDYNLRQFWQHQLRWARGVRDSRRGGYVGLLFTFGWIWSLLAVFASGGAGWAWALVGTAVLSRFLVALTVGNRVLDDPQVIRFLPLLPLRDLTALAIWFASFGSNIIDWRGDKFRLKNGKLVRLTTDKEQPT